MDDLSGKIGEILSDPDSMRELSELAAMFRNETGSPPAESNTPPANPAAGELFDPAMLAKLGTLMQSQQQPDKNAALLLALKPHLGERRRLRVDKAIKLMRLYALWKTAQQSGMLQDLI